jgi:hypothetical protein
MDKFAQDGSVRVGGQERFCVAPPQIRHGSLDLGALLHRTQPMNETIGKPPPVGSVRGQVPAFELLQPGDEIGTADADRQLGAVAPSIHDQAP